MIEDGLVRFDYPEEWTIEAAVVAVHLYDGPECDESCNLAVSTIQGSPEFLEELSLDNTLHDSLKGRENLYEQSEIRRITRGDLEIVWLEQKFVDAKYRRDARFRYALARGAALCLISLRHWSDRVAGPEEAWDEVLRTLVVGVDPEADPERSVTSSPRAARSNPSRRGSGSPRSCGG